MVSANPFMVHGSGGSKPKSLGGPAANQIWRLCQPLNWFTAPAKLLRKKFIWIVIHLVSNNKICRPTKFVRQGAVCHHKVGTGSLPVIERPGVLIIPAEHLGRLGESPGQIFIEAQDSDFPDTVSVARPDGRHLAAIGGKIADLGKTAYIAGFQHNCQRDNLADAGYCLQTGELLELFCFVFHGYFNFPDLTRKIVNTILANGPAHGQIFLGCQ